MLVSFMDIVSWTFFISVLYTTEDWVSLYPLPVQASGIPVFWVPSCLRGEFWQDSTKCPVLSSHYNKNCLAKGFQWKFQWDYCFRFFILGNSCSVFLPRQKGSQNSCLRAWAAYGVVVGWAPWAAGKSWISPDRVSSHNQNKKAKLLGWPTCRSARLAQEE